MKCIILCAGYATRLRKYINSKPKALITIQDKPILNYLIEKIEKIHEVTEIIIVSNKKYYNQFLDWQKNIKTNKSIKIIHDNTSREEEKLGAIGDIQYVINHENIEDDMIVMASDNFFDFDLNEMMTLFHQKQGAIICTKKISDIELEEFSLTFDTKYKFYNILFKVYGDNLEDEAKVMADEKGYFSQVIFKLRQIYASFSKLTEKRINDYLGYNDKKWNKLLKNLDKESEIYQASLPIVGENLDKVIDYKILTEEQRNILRIFINYLRSININKKEIKKTNTVEIINDEEYSKFLTPFKHPFFKEFVKLLPIEYRFITMLRLGLYDDKIYSLKELSVIFNIGENEVLLRTEMGILLFKNFIQEYERIYGQNFPELEGESGTMLKLLPQK